MVKGNVMHTFVCHYSCIKHDLLFSMLFGTYYFSVTVKYQTVMREILDERGNYVIMVIIAR